MTLFNFGKIAAVSAVTCSLAAVATAQGQAQTYQQQQAYYRAWQQYYQQYYGQNYQQPAYQSRRGYTTTRPQRSRSWYSPQQQQTHRAEQPRRSAPGVDPQNEYPVVNSNQASNAARSIDLDSRNTRKSTSQAEDNTVWYNSFDPAWKSAYKQGRPLVLLFVHEGCPECSRMDGYLAQPGAMETLASAVKARIEFTENPATVSRFGVKFTPTFLVLNPQGNEAYREVGALDVNRLRQIQPALESLVTAPPQADTADVKRPGESKNQVSYAPATDDMPADVAATSQTIAAL